MSASKIHSRLAARGYIVSVDLLAVHALRSARKTMGPNVLKQIHQFSRKNQGRFDFVAPYASPGTFIGTGIVSKKSERSERWIPFLSGSWGGIGTEAQQVNDYGLQSVLALAVAGPDS